MTKTPPFKYIVNKQGYFTEEYMEWATKRENYPDSSLAIEDMGSDQNIKKIKDTVYVETLMRFTDRQEAEIYIKKIIGMGGLAVVIPFTQRKTKMYKIWFNPNGSKKAREYVSGW